MESFEPGKVQGYSDEEMEDLIKNHHFIPVVTADELNNVRSATSETYGEGTEWEGKYTGGLDKQYVQVADIDLSGIENFEPIGKYNSEFTGIYDGGGYVISNLTIDRGATDVVGLFGSVVGATFKNIGLGNVNVTGGSHVGGLVGYQWSSSVTNSYATGSVTGGNYTGGLVGRQEGSTISDSYATGSVTGGNYTGGLVGYQYYSSVSNSYATGPVNGAGDQVGGLVGGQGEASVTNSYWDKGATKQEESEGGTGKTTAEMKNKGTYTDWDFDTVWEIEDGQYPTLR